MPLVPKPRVGGALCLLEKRGKQQSEEAQKCCTEILNLVKRVYINGLFCLEVDLVQTPVTNNANEGTNRGLAEEFGQHPQANRRLTICCDVLNSAEYKIEKLVDGSIRPYINEMYETEERGQTWKKLRTCKQTFFMKIVGFLDQ